MKNSFAVVDYLYQFAIARRCFTQFLSRQFPLVSAYLSAKFLLRLTVYTESLRLYKSFRKTGAELIVVVVSFTFFCWWNSFCSLRYSRRCYADTCHKRCCSLAADQSWPGPCLPELCMVGFFLEVVRSLFFHLKRGRAFVLLHGESKRSGGLPRPSWKEEEILHFLASDIN